MIAEVGLRNSPCYSYVIVHAQSQWYLDMFKFCLEECLEITLMSQITVYTQRVCLCCEIKEDQGENLNIGFPFVYIIERSFCFLVGFFW